MIDPKLHDKVVFITGANHGIGADKRNILEKDNENATADI